MLLEALEFRTLPGRPLVLRSRAFPELRAGLGPRLRSVRGGRAFLVPRAVRALLLAPGPRMNLVLAHLRACPGLRVVRALLLAPGGPRLNLAPGVVLALPAVRGTHAIPELPAILPRPAVRKLPALPGRELQATLE